MPKLRSLLRKWQSHPRGELHCAVMRHAERADSDSCLSEDSWALSSDGQQWPLDPPLSSRGVAHARKVAAQELVPYQNASTGHKECWTVVSSPYLRCVQTALQLCVELGPKSRLLLDHELGEIYGPETMGDHEPKAVLRPVEEVWALCKWRKVRYCPRLVGQMPCWPETTTQMRSRVVRCFLQYLRRGVVAHRNFVIVTHADGVGAALAAMPSVQGRSIQKVDFGGFFLASTHVKVGSNQKIAATSGPAPSEEVSTQHDEEDCFIKLEPEPPLPPRPSNMGDSWEVRISGVHLGPRCKHEWRRDGMLASLRRITQRTGLSDAEISRLLRCLPGRPMMEELPQLISLTTWDFSQSSSSEISPSNSLTSPGLCFPCYVNSPTESGNGKLRKQPMQTSKPLFQASNEHNVSEFSSLDCSAGPFHRSVTGPSISGHSDQTDATEKGRASCSFELVIDSDSSPPTKSASTLLKRRGIHPLPTLLVKQ